jgi:flagellar motor switch protein FliN/FliY
MSMLESIAAVRDVPIRITAELDRKAMTVAEILNLEAGSVVRMLRSADENIDILAGGAMLASGEIVAIEDAVAVRITEFPGDK